MYIRFTQVATYWAPDIPNQYGERAFEDPVTISCRWENKNQLVVDKNGQEQVAKSCIHTITELAVDGYLFLGTSSEANPINVKGADRLLTVNFSQTLSRTKTTRLYEGYL